jgi:putative heme-binding domain-containing protein
MIRKEFTSYIVETNDGRTLTGLMAEQTPGMITLLGANGERTGVARADVREIRESPISLMPEDQLSKMTPDQLRDLFAYLQSDGKGAP